MYAYGAYLMNKKRETEMGMEKTQIWISYDIAKEGISLITSGKVRNHKMGDSSRIHTGEIEKKECQIYRDFLPTKNCCMVYELTGSELL